MEVVADEFGDILGNVIFLLSRLNSLLFRLSHNHFRVGAWNETTVEFHSLFVFFGEFEQELVWFNHLTLSSDFIVFIAKCFEIDLAILIII